MNEQDWQAFVELFLKAESEDRMSALLQFFLTHSERESLVDRYTLVRALLKKDRSQREIAEDLGISIAKITAGSNELKRSSDELKAFLTEQMS